MSEYRRAFEWFDREFFADVNLNEVDLSWPDRRRFRRPKRWERQPVPLKTEDVLAEVDVILKGGAS